MLTSKARYTQTHHLSFSLWGLTHRNGSICVTHTRIHTTHWGIQSNYQAVNDCRASAVLQPFITRASSGPYCARETAYHTPHHLMGLMQPINQQKSRCEVRQAPPISNTLWFMFLYQSKVKHWIGISWIVIFFYLLKCGYCSENCNYSCKNYSGKRRVWSELICIWSPFHDGACLSGRRVWLAK